MWSQQILMLVAFSLAVLGTGCKSAPAPSNSAPPTPTGINQLNLITVPVAMNVDDVPGPDGISIKIFANTANEPKPVPLREGVLEVLMWDGVLQPKTNPPVLRTFRFEARELRPYEFRAKIGTGYELTLLWGTNRPTQRIMSVAARYTTPAGKPVLSRPSSVTVLSK